MLATSSALADDPQVKAVIPSTMPMHANLQRIVLSIPSAIHSPDG
jgi:hypothetical protein